MQSAGRTSETTSLLCLCPVVRGSMLCSLMLVFVIPWLSYVCSDTAMSRCGAQSKRKNCNHFSITNARIAITARAI